MSVYKRILYTIIRILYADYLLSMHLRKNYYCVKPCLELLPYKRPSKYTHITMLMKDLFNFSTLRAVILKLSLDAIDQVKTWNSNSSI